MTTAHLVDNNAISHHRPHRRRRTRRSGYPADELVQQPAAVAAPIPLAAADDGDESLEVGHVGVLSYEQWIDMDLGTGPGRIRTFSDEHGADLLEADRGGDEWPGIDGTARVRRNGGVETRRA
jgi:hypothetical protein